MKVIITRPRLVKGEYKKAGDPADLPAKMAKRYIATGKAIPAEEEFDTKEMKPLLESLNKAALITIADGLGVKSDGLKKDELVDALMEEGAAAVALAEKAKGDKDKGDKK